MLRSGRAAGLDQHRDVFRLFLAGATGAFDHALIGAILISAADMRKLAPLLKRGAIMVIG